MLVPEVDQYVLVRKPRFFEDEEEMSLQLTGVSDM
jgi:hypothetical protein